MDWMMRSSEIFAAAQARHPGSCLPGGATSPADRLGTVVLPHELIAQCEARQPGEPAKSPAARTPGTPSR